MITCPAGPIDGREKKWRQWNLIFSNPMRLLCRFVRAILYPRHCQISLAWRVRRTRFAAFPRQKGAVTVLLASSEILYDIKAPSRCRGLKVTSATFARGINASSSVSFDWTWRFSRRIIQSSPSPRSRTAAATEFNPPLPSGPLTPPACLPAKTSISSSVTSSAAAFAGACYSEIRVSWRILPNNGDAIRLY